ncbi:beta-ketoacyl synthase [Xylaria grammica]|nr:beta-ketoacyl synthase [Xylaria grammica]
MGMDEPIASIGVGARYPGDGDTPEHFYGFLLAGRPACPKTTIRHGHFLKGSMAAFDAPFFSITPKEASGMDPQQRGMLECVYAAPENAGICLENAAGTHTGIYVGCQDLKYAATGSVASMLSNRISWFYNLRGPSLNIDTACSSSLVAMHQACNSPELGGVLGLDGVCQGFNKKGNRYGRGQGFSVVVLERVSDCIRDGDTIRAVIRNPGSNQNGRSPGIT